MKVSRVFTLLVALTFAGTALAAAQGRSGAHRPSTMPTQAAKGGSHGAKGHGPKADKVRPDHAAHANEPRTIASNIAKNPKLEARLKTMLPAGMTLEQASDGFRNQGQFIAALEASKNQNIPFADLKAQMTGDDALSLGQAIQKLRPSTTTTQNEAGS